MPTLAPLAPAPPFTPRQERFWAILIPVGGIFFHFLPALLGYSLLRDRGPFIREQSRAALNFQFTLLATYVVALFTLWLGIGFVLLAAAAVLNIVLSVLSAIAAERGEIFDYPLSFPFLRS
jgi:uncharacterized Tic20 family protein